MKRMGIIRFIAALLILPSSLAAQQPDFVGPRINDFSAGIYCAPGTVGSVPAPGTVSGTRDILSVEPDFVATTRNVPAVIGLGFGVKSRAKIYDIPDVIYTITHPPMGPEGATQQTFTDWIGTTENDLMMYGFDYDYEMVYGLWTFTAMAEGEMLFRASFNVVPPEMVPELASVCGYEHLLS